MLAGINWKLLAFIGNCAVIAALLIGLLATRATLADEKRETARAEAHLSISNSSVERLEGQITRMTAEAHELSTSDAARMEASRQALKIAEAASKVREAVIIRLEKSAAAMMDKPMPDTCEASSELLSQWK